MLNSHLPTIVLRDAWTRVQPSPIQDAVEKAIVELEAVARWEDTFTDDSRVGARSRSAHQAALQACCSEMRSEAGLPQSSSRPSIDGREPDWRSEYLESLERYRELSAISLSSSLGSPPGTTCD